MTGLKGEIMSCIREQCAFHASVKSHGATGPFLHWKSPWELCNGDALSLSSLHVENMSGMRWSWCSLSLFLSVCNISSYNSTVQRILHFSNKCVLIVYGTTYRVRHKIVKQASYYVIVQQYLSSVLVVLNKTNIRILLQLLDMNENIQTCFVALLKIILHVIDCV